MGKLKKFNYKLQLKRILAGFFMVFRCIFIACFTVVAMKMLIYAIDYLSSTSPLVLSTPLLLLIGIPLLWFVGLTDKEEIKLKDL